MALPPPSASNDEVRVAIGYIRKYSGHNFTFKRGKRGYNWGNGISYDTWPSAVCKDCGTRFIWDTYESSRLSTLIYAGCDPKNFWRAVVSPSVSSKKHIDEIPSCNHIRMLEALE